MSPEAAVVRRKHNRDAREQSLIEAATAVFAEKGYDAATTREVAERAGCSEGLIHRYFGGKRGLLMGALREKGRAVAETIRESVPDHDDLHDEIRALMLFAVAFMWEQRSFMRVSCARAIIDGEIGRYVDDEINQRRVEIAEQKLRRHQQAGRIRDDVDVETVAEAIAGITFESGFFLRVVFERPEEDVRRAVRQIAHIIVRGIESDAYRAERLARGQEV
jgi:AcrR family transcriptional regulator